MFVCWVTLILESVAREQYIRRVCRATSGEYNVNLISKLLLSFEKSEVMPKRKMSGNNKEPN